MQLLPKKADGTVTYDPSPTDVTTDVALVSVSSDWSTSSIDSFAAPLKVVHHAACSSPPTLELPLNTNIAGTLTVGTLTVGGADISAGSWQSGIATASGFAGSNLHGVPGTVWAGLPAWLLRR
jgi:hypothetical protein